MYGDWLLDYVASPDQGLVIQQLSEEVGNDIINVTIRVTFQLHGIVKKNIKPSLRTMLSRLLNPTATYSNDR